MKCENGDIFAWYVTDAGTGNVCKNRFATMADAMKYAELFNMWLASCDAPAEKFRFGTEGDYQAGAQEALKEARQAEVAKYREHVAGLVAALKAEIKALEGLKATAGQFDGKVINVRFHDAVKAATGFSCGFREYRGLVLTDYRHHPYTEVSIYTDFSRGVNQSAGAKDREISPDVWQWGTGDRLEAGKAAAVIDRKINDRKARIAELQGSVRQYAAYVKKARALAEQIKALTASVPDTLRRYAQEHDLRSTAPTTQIWK